MHRFYSPSTGWFYDPADYGYRMISVPDPQWVRPLTTVVLQPGAGYGEAFNAGDEPLTLVDVPDLMAIPAMVMVDNPNCRLPADVVPVTEEELTDLMHGQSTGLPIIVDGEGKPVLGERPPLTPEQTRANWKADRQAAVDSITVDVDSLIFDGDEISQARMARALLVLQDGETTLWVLADNSPAQVSRGQLKEALRLAGIRQTELWLPPT